MIRSLLYLHLLLVFLKISFSFQCGIQQHQLSNILFSNTDTSKKIIGGSRARIGQWPWQVLLEFLNYENHVTTCGGTLISERHVLTAAHCAVMIQHSLDQARAFVSTIHSKNEDRGISLEIAFVKIHDEYDFRTNRNDIAVLTLAKALSFNPTIQPICFAEKNFEFPSDARFWTAGWGAYNRGKSIVIEASDRLMYTSLPNVNLKECRRLWATLTADHLQGFEPDFDSTQICAGDDGRGTAMGDSGGPLMIEKNGTWIQVGITSFGINNDHTLLYNQKRAPGIYTRVSAYHDFIEKSLLHSMVSSDNSTSTRHIICVGIFSFLVLTFLYLAFYQINIIGVGIFSFSC